MARIFYQFYHGLAFVLDYQPSLLNRPLKYIDKLQMVRLQLIQCQILFQFFLELFPCVTYLRNQFYNQNLMLVMIQAQILMMHHSIVIFLMLLLNHYNFCYLLGTVRNIPLDSFSYNLAMVLMQVY